MLKFTRYLPLLFLFLFANADTVFQSDWSMGSGLEGPSPIWLSFFHMESGIDITETGLIKMGTGITSYEEQIIASGFGGNGFSTPGDFDGDGDIDIICDDTNQWEFNLYENLDGAGTQWQQHYIFDMPSIPNKEAEAVDLDADGDLDLLTATGGYFTFWENSDGSGLNWEQHNLVSDSIGDATDLFSVDIDNDGDLDVIGSDNLVNHAIYAWENLDGMGHQWQEHIVVQSTDGWPMNIEEADIDNDNDSDLFFTNENSSNAWTGWFEYQGNWTWQINKVTDAPAAQSLSTADYDNDGDMDYSIATGEYYIIWMNIDGVGGSWQYNYCSGLPGYNILYSQSRDIDNDGDIDIIGSGYKNDANDVLYVFENLDGLGTNWTTHVLFTDYSDVYFRGIADVNNDGYMNIIGSVVPLNILWCSIVGPAHEGWLQSTILDAQEYPLWESIAWTSDEPGGTDITFLLRSSNDSENMGDWCNTISAPGSLTGYIDSTHRFIQYMACLTTDSDNYTPALDEISLVLTSTGIEDENKLETITISAYPNPFNNEVSIAVPMFMDDASEVSIYDISGKLVIVLTERTEDAFLWNGRNTSGQITPVGAYVVRYVSGELSSTTRILKL